MLHTIFPSRLLFEEQLKGQVGFIGFLHIAYIFLLFVLASAIVCVFVVTSLLWLTWGIAMPTRGIWRERGAKRNNTWSKKTGHQRSWQDNQRSQDGHRSSQEGQTWWWSFLHLTLFIHRDSKIIDRDVRLWDVSRRNWIWSTAFKFAWWVCLLWENPCPN